MSKTVELSRSTVLSFAAELHRMSGNLEAMHIRLAEDAGVPSAEKAAAGGEGERTCAGCLGQVRLDESSAIWMCRKCFTDWHDNRSKEIEAAFAAPEGGGIEYIECETGRHGECKGEIDDHPRGPCICQCHALPAPVHTTAGDALANAAWEVWQWWHHNIRGKGQADKLSGWTVFPVRLMDSVVDQFIEDENALGDAVRAYRAAPSGPSAEEVGELLAAADEIEQIRSDCGLVHSAGVIDDATDFETRYGHAALRIRRALIPFRKEQPE